MTHKSDRHVKALQRRHDYLKGIHRNDFDKAELAALNWALTWLKPIAEDEKACDNNIAAEEAFWQSEMLTGD
jgi:hypothetical protein